MVDVLRNTEQRQRSRSNRTLREIADHLHDVSVLLEEMMRLQHAQLLVQSGTDIEVMAGFQRPELRRPRQTPDQPEQDVHSRQ